MKSLLCACAATALIAAPLAAPLAAQNQLDLSGPRVTAAAPAAAPAALPDAALLAPADAALFVQLDDLPALHEQLHDDALFQMGMKRLGREPREAWMLIQAAMGMTGDELLRQYFGKRVALIVETPGQEQPGVVATAVDAASFDLARTRLDLRPLLDPVGAFQKFTTADGETLAAFGEGWMLVTGADHGAFLDRVLEHVQKRGPTLAADPTFTEALRRLPAQRQGVAFARDAKKGEIHALALQQEGKATTLHYAGRSPQLREMLQRRGDAQALTFGPLPADAIAALALNLELPAEARRPQARAMVDRLLAPEMTAERLTTLIDHVSVMFLGEVAPDAIEPNPGLRVPALGLALRLKSDDASKTAAAAAFDKLINNALLFANLATLEWQTDPIAMGAAAHGGVNYRTAAVGAVLAQRTQRPELGALRLAYGRIGDWYVLTTQDVFFTRMIDTHAKGGGAAAPAASDHPLAAMTFDPKALGVHVESWLAHWRAVRPEVMNPNPAQPLTPEQRLVQQLTEAVQVLNHYGQLSMTMESIDGDQTLRATVRVTR